jgi:sporulation protein YlmC with PRC-barrel domain
MLSFAKELFGHKVITSDNEIVGTLDDLLFDDRYWTIRYLVLETGNWLLDRKVVISPFSLLQADWKEAVIPVNLSKEQIESSPQLAKHQPVSRKKEVELAKYYGWPSYWAGMAARVPGIVEMPMDTVPEIPIENEDEPEQKETHLRSIKSVTGYHILARDGEIGHVEDFILNRENWLIRLLEIDTRNWLPGKKVAVFPRLIDKVSWLEQRLHIKVDQETIKNAPEFESKEITIVDYEQKLKEYYTR